MPGLWTVQRHTRALAEEQGELRVETIMEGLLEEVTADFLRMSRS